MQLVIDGRSNEEQAQRLIDSMCEAFGAAMVPAAEIEQLEPEMDNERKDRHVLAAAVAVEAEMLVTFEPARLPALRMRAAVDRGDPPR